MGNDEKPTLHHCSSLMPSSHQHCTHFTLTALHTSDPHHMVCPHVSGPALDVVEMDCDMRLLYRFMCVPSVCLMHMHVCALCVPGPALDVVEMDDNFIDQIEESEKQVADLTAQVPKTLLTPIIRSLPRELWQL